MTPLKWKRGLLQNGIVKIHFSSIRMNYREAIAYCANNEAFLAEVTSEEDRIYLQSLLDSFSGNSTDTREIWIGHSYDSENNVWIKRSDGLIINWNGWLMYSPGDKDFPFLSSHVGGNKNEKLISSPKQFFCVKYLQSSPFRNTLKALPNKIVSSSSQYIVTKYDTKCRSDICWNIMKCSTMDTFKVHVDLISSLSIVKSNEDNIPLLELFPSIEFYELYKWIKNSPYHTENIEEACITIPAFDLLSYSRIEKHEKEIGEFIQNRTSWNKGFNNAIFNFQPPSNMNGTQFEQFPSGKSIIASSSLRHSNIRNGFDVPIPYYSKMVNLFKSNSQNDKRPQDLLIFGDLRVDIQSVLNQFMKSDKSSKFAILKLRNCDSSSSHFNPRDPICDQFNFKHENIKMILSQSRFCLISFNEFDYFQNLYMSIALGSGCVPIIVGMDHVLPYETRIDWSLAVTRIQIRDLLTLDHFLKRSIKLEDKRAQGRVFLIFLLCKPSWHSQLHIL